MLRAEKLVIPRQELIIWLFNTKRSFLKTYTKMASERLSIYICAESGNDSKREQGGTCVSSWREERKERNVIMS